MQDYGSSPSQGHRPANSLFLSLQKHLILVCSLPVFIHLLEHELDVLKHLPQCQLKVGFLLLKLGHRNGNRPAAWDVPSVCMYVYCVVCHMHVCVCECVYVHVSVCMCVHMHV